MQHQNAPSIDVRPRLLTPEEVAQILSVSPKTLAAWRQGNDVRLPFVRLGGEIRGSIRYLESDLDAFIVASRCQPSAA